MSGSDNEQLARQRAARVRVQAPDDAQLLATPGAAEHNAEEFYVRQLIRSQLKLAILVASGILLLLVGITILLSSWPAITQISILTIPLPWWILGVGMYPLIILAGVLYNFSAVRNEKRYRSIAK